ncbi:protein S100-P-like [Cheilinus undulatus]|uniref:protein S100-P-like n=1 Tax=Cheilinus undulatus TaxID=241271 RepID=UPI001BD45641|nr:protein S100-P-like [Cheilinus undulatus]
MQEKDVCISSLKAAVCLLVGTFNKYAGADGCAESLNFAEFKALVQNELPELLENPNCQKEMDEVFSKMDSNGDKAVDFQEYVTTVAALACIFHELCPKV